MAALTGLNIRAFLAFPQDSRTALTSNVRHDNGARWIASLPFLIRRFHVPNSLQKQTTRSAGRDRLVTMKPTW
jgi:hypothetical protein